MSGSGGNWSKGRTEKVRPSVPHGACPLCQQQLPSGDFIHTADFTVVVRNYHIARLTMQEANAFKTMRAGPLTTEALAERLNTSIHVAYVFIMNIRRKLLPLGIKICCAGNKYQVQYCAW